MLRAIFEGVMFEHRRHIEVLGEAGVSFANAALSGGGSRSAHWPQMFADGLGVPVTVAEASETTNARMEAESLRIPFRPSMSIPQ